jgi:hypothetical protein
MNVVVAERLGYFDSYVEPSQLKDECRQHIFPVYTPNPSYSALILAHFSGTFMVLFALLVFSTFVLIGEIIVKRYQRRQETEDEILQFNIALKVDTTIPLHIKDVIHSKYVEITEQIQELMDLMEHESTLQQE